MKKFVYFCFILILLTLIPLLLFYKPVKKPVISPPENKKETVVQSSQMKITSSVFIHKGKIPSKYTCDGENINPPLKFSDIPENAKSLVLLMDDPDVPKNLKPDGMWDHWVIYNIPPGTKEIKENATPPSGIVGLNTSMKTVYTGPCPPDRQHRYFFKLYALDTQLDLPENTDKAMVEAAMKDHILAQSELIGLYERK